MDIQLQLDLGIMSGKNQHLIVSPEIVCNQSGSPYCVDPKDTISGPKTILTVHAIQPGGI